MTTVGVQCHSGDYRVDNSGVQDHSGEYSGVQDLSGVPDGVHSVPPCHGTTPLPTTRVPPPAPLHRAPPPVVGYSAHHAFRSVKNVKIGQNGAKWVLQITTVSVQTDDTDMLDDIV